MVLSYLPLVPPFLIFAMAPAQVAGNRHNSGIGMNACRELLTLRSKIRRSAQVAVSACALVFACAALAQDTNQPAEPTPPEAFKPGFIDAFGRWLEQGAAKFRSDMKDAQEQVDRFGNQARDAAKETTGAVVGLPNAQVVTGRERCAAVQGGGSDCQRAADTVCRGKGFQGGRSVDTQSEQKCSAKFLLEGRAPNETECPTTIFVTRAMCQ